MAEHIFAGPHEYAHVGFELGGRYGFAIRHESRTLSEQNGLLTCVARAQHQPSIVQTETTPENVMSPRGKEVREAGQALEYALSQPLGRDLDQTWKPDVLPGAAAERDQSHDSAALQQRAKRIGNNLSPSRSGERPLASSRLS